MDEEAKIRLGLDISPFKQNLRLAEREMASAGGNMHGTFIKAGSAAKGFKNALHEISAESPIMGTALRFAISPIVGAFAAATLAAGYFKGNIDKINERSDELEKGMSDPITKYRDNIREAHKALAEFRYEQAKWLKDLTANDHTINEQLSKRLEALGAQSTRLKTLGGGDVNTERQRLEIQLGLQKGALKALGFQGDDLGGRLAVQSGDMMLLNRSQKSKRAGQINEKELKEQENLKRMIQGEADDVRGLGKIEALGRAVFGGETPEKIVGDAQARIDAYRAMLKASQNRMEKNNDIIDQEAEARKQLTDQINTTRGKLKDIHTTQQQLSKDIIGTTRELSYLPGSAPTSLYQPMDFGAAAGTSEAKRLDAVRKNDLAYRIAHMNDPKSAAGTPVVTTESIMADMRQQLVELNTKATTGVFIITREQ